MQMQMIDPTVLKFNNIRNMERIKSSPEFQELVDSVREEGVLAPVQIYPVKSDIVGVGDDYYIKDGHRRVLAAIQAGCEKIPFTETNPPTERELALHQVILNMTQQKLNPMEQARAFALLVDRYGVNQKDIAKSLGRSPGYVSQFLSLVGLPPHLQARVESGQLKYTAAYRLSTLPPSALGEKETKGIRTVKHVNRYKKQLNAAREVQIEIVTGIKLEEGEPLDENTVMVFSLFQMATDALSRAMALAKEHEIPVTEKVVQIEALIGACQGRGG